MPSVCLTVMPSVCLPANAIPAYPGTLDAAVETLVRNLDLHSRYALARLSRDELPDNDSPLAKQCRELLGLDGQNARCACADEETTIRLIIEAVWRNVQRHCCD